MPAAVVAFGMYVGCLLWTVSLSFTNSRVLPSFKWAGFKQYAELIDSARWNTSVQNIIIFGVWYVVLCLIIGYILAVLLDQKVRGEAILRTIYLSPQAMSLIVTGLVWAWFLNPDMGLQSFVRGLGWESFSFAWLADPTLAIYAVVIAGVWRGAGLVMILMLAGLRGVDQEMLKNLQVDGVPKWRVYAQVIPPILTPMIITSVVLLTAGVINSYDLVVAMTRGGPGIATEVPGKFVMEHFFGRGDVGLATAGAAAMLGALIMLAGPLLFIRWIMNRRH
ncbi:MAG: sugar ABC transporter permease [Bradyrhizobium sp.]|nr:sugar ABC transporter permease [Bradyrhizobium sp.]